MGVEERRPIYNHRGVGRALTILEVLVAILLSSVLGVALYHVFWVQDRTYTIQSEISEMEQNLRVAMERISRDLTMAGFARPPWTTVNGQGNLDFALRVGEGTVVDMVGSFDGAQAVLREAAAPGATSLVLSSGGGDRFNTTTKRDINIGGRENARIVAIKGNTLTVDTGPDSAAQGLLFGYQAGTEVYLVKWKTYWVDNSDPKQPVLRVNEHLGSGSQQLALFITGLEIALSGRTAEVTLAGRSRNPDKTTGRYVTGRLTNRIVLRNLP